MDFWWEKRCSKAEWQKEGSASWLCEMQGNIAGTTHKIFGMYLNADLPPKEALESGIHEMFHTFHYNTKYYRMHVAGTALEAEAEKEAEAFTARIMATIHGIINYKAELQAYQHTTTRRVIFGSPKDIRRMQARYASC